MYHNVAESIADHGQLLATGQSYQQAMADRHLPDAFANDLTGVYATDPNYGSNLIAMMKLYNLYQYNAPAPRRRATRPACAGQQVPRARRYPAAQAPRAERTAAAISGYNGTGAGPARRPGRAVTPGATGTPGAAGSRREGTSQARAAPQAAHAARPGARRRFRVSSTPTPPGRRRSRLRSLASVNGAQIRLKPSEPRRPAERPGRRG